MKCAKYLLFSLLSILLLGFINHSNVNAASLTALPSGRLYRAWSQNSGQTWQYNSNYTDWVLNDLPISALSANATYTRYVKGFRVVGNPPEANSSYTVNAISEISVLFKQIGTYSYGVCESNQMYNLGYSGEYTPYMRYISGNNVLGTETFSLFNFKCYEEISGNGNTIIQFDFDGYATTDNSAINGIDFRWGDAMTTPTQQLGGIAGLCTTGNYGNNCTLGYTLQFMGITYKYTLSNDPAIVYQNTIINQNQQIINNQNQQIAQDQEDRDNISNTKDDGDDASSDAQSDSEQAMSNFFGVINLFIGALQTPATDCKVRSDLGHLDLGVLDFCSGKPNEFIPIIRVAILLVMAIPVYLICRRIIDDFINITVFAQGGK